MPLLTKSGCESSQNPPAPPPSFSTILNFMKYNSLLALRCRDLKLSTHNVWTHISIPSIRRFCTFKLEASMKSMSIVHKKTNSSQMLSLNITRLCMLISRHNSTGWPIDRMLSLWRVALTAWPPSPLVLMLAATFF